MQKNKMAVWGGLQIAVKRTEAKSKGEKERHKHLNAEFQRIARRDKKAFFSGQCKEIEDNNRLGKTRDLFKKIRDTKGTFPAKMGLIKDRNGSWAWCIGRGPHLQLRQEPQGTSDFRLRSQGPCRLGTGESGLVLG